MLDAFFSGLVVQGLRNAGITDAIASLDIGHLKSTPRKRVSDVTALLGRHTAQARQMLRKLLVNKIELEPSQARTSSTRSVLGRTTRTSLAGTDVFPVDHHVAFSSRGLQYLVRRGKRRGLLVVVEALDTPYSLRSNSSRKFECPTSSCRAGRLRGPSSIGIPFASGTAFPTLTTSGESNSIVAMRGDLAFSFSRALRSRRAPAAADDRRDGRPGSSRWARVFWFHVGCSPECRRSRRAHRRAP